MKITLLAVFTLSLVAPVEGFAKPHCKAEDYNVVTGKCRDQLAKLDEDTIQKNENDDQKILLEGFTKEDLD